MILNETTFDVKHDLFKLTESLDQNISMEIRLLSITNLSGNPIATCHYQEYEEY